MKNKMSVLISMLAVLLLTRQLGYCSHYQTGEQDNISQWNNYDSKALFSKRYELAGSEITTTPPNPSCHGQWTVVKEYNGSTSCECGSDLSGVLQCDSKSFEVKLLSCYCLSHSENITVVGACLAKCHSVRGSYFYSVQETDDEKVCEIHGVDMARAGQLCGGCKKGFSVPAYSYNWHCVNCSTHSDNIKHWAVYITIAFLPLTVFFLVVTTLHIRVTSPTMNSFILSCQLLSAPIQLRQFIITLFVNETPSFIKWAIQFCASIYGVWNLDFFRLIYPSFCLYPGSSTLLILALDYTVAVYPLLLIVVTYILVELHDHNFRIVVWLWRPFQYCSIRFRRSWDIRTSLIDAFATFLLLSYVKFLSVSIDLLVPVNLYNAHGKVVDVYLYFDATVKYFSKEHFPYFILAIVILLLFNILPVILLCLYPCLWFQKLLTPSRLRCHALHTFMDVFQGCYKNRSDNTCDRRWFASVYFVVRMVFLLVAMNIHSKLLYCVFIAMLMIITALIVGTIQPYNLTIFNAVDAFLFLVLALGYLSIVQNILADANSFTYIGLSRALIMLCAMVPFVYITIVILYWLLLRKRMLHPKIWLLVPCRCFRQLDNLDGELLPDRLTNPTECTALLQDPMDVNQHYVLNEAITM